MGTAGTDVGILRRGWAVWVALWLGGLGLGFGFLVSLVLLAGLYVTTGEPSVAMLLVISLISVQGVGCIVVSLTYVGVRPFVAGFLEDGLGVRVLRRELRLEARVPDLTELVLVVAGWMAALLGAFVLAAGVERVLTELLNEEQPAANQVAEMGMEQPELLLLLIPASFLLIGPGEELLFRGVVQGRLREVFGPAVAIGLASVFFAGIHFTALTGGSTAGNVARLTILLVPSLVLGVTYEYTDNIVVPALIHGAYNATLFGILYVAVTYYDDLEQLQQAGGALVGL